MCTIIDLPAGKTFPFVNLKNAVLNNPDGFGIVTVDRGKLEAVKFWDEKGNDPDKVAKELEERYDVQRFLHLRYATAGDKEPMNAHPFTIMNGPDVRVEFMHNGTFYKFKETGAKESDTNLFTQKLLKPLLTRYHGEEGYGDIQDAFLKKILDEYFNTTNRGLLISNKQDPLFLGGWVNFEGFRVSNNDYFKEALNSRMSDHFKKLREKEEEEARAARFRNSQQAANAQAVATYEEKKVTLLREVDLSRVARFLTPLDLESLFGYSGLTVDDDLLGSIGYLSTYEIQDWVAKNSENAARLIDYLAIRLTDLSGDFEALKEKKLKGEKVIKELSQEVKKLSAKEEDKNGK